MRKALITIVVFSSFIACRKDIQREEELPGLTDEALTLATTEAELTGIAQALEDNIDYLSAYTETNTAAGSKAKPVCPDITISGGGQDQFPQTITIDYGTGCTGRRDRNLSGIVQISKSASWLQADASRTVTFTNFSLDNIRISGTKTITYDGTSNGVGQFSVTSDLTFTWSDGYWVRRVQKKTRSVIAGIETTDDTDNAIEITGQITDTDSNGLVLTKTIKEPLTIIPKCTYFVSGKVDVSKNNELLFTLDFGSGTCDNKATITLNNDTREILLTKTRGN